MSASDDICKGDRDGGVIISAVDVHIPRALVAHVLCWVTLQYVPIIS